MTLRKTIKWLLHSYCPGFAGWFKYGGTKVYFPKNAWIFKLACEQGVYESELQALILGLIKPNTWYFDVGANIGLMSVPILSQRTNAKVMSFEPSPNASPYLLKTRAESPWGDRWTVLSKAVGKSKGEAEFSFGEAALGGFDGLFHTQRVAQAGSQKVEITTLDDEWRGLGQPLVSFIKMDIEGAELDALRGAANLLKTCRPHVIVEWYDENLVPYGVQSEDLLQFAHQSGYELVCVPTMTVVHSIPMLKALMLQTSAFMLMPTD